MSVCAVITAAGLSSRMGAFKPLLPIGGKPTVLHLIDTFLRSGVSHIVLVTGHRHTELEVVCKDIPNLTIILNPDYASTEMLHSVQLGLDAVPRDAGRILFIPIDVPLVTVSTVTKLIEDTRPLLFPSYQYRRGHPAAIDHRLLPELLRYSGQNGLRGAFASLSVPPSYLVVHDPLCLMDMDTPEDYQNILKYSQGSETVQ